MLAFFDSLGWQEMFLLVVIGLLLYGRNLPQAGRNVGRMLGRWKRVFDDFKRQIDRDSDLHEMRDSLKGVANDLKRVADVPRAIGNPAQAARTLARDAILSPAPADDDTDTDAGAGAGQPAADRTNEENA